VGGSLHGCSCHPPPVPPPQGGGDAEGRVGPAASCRDLAWGAEPRRLAAAQNAAMRAKGDGLPTLAFRLPPPLWGGTGRGWQNIPCRDSPPPPNPSHKGRGIQRGPCHCSISPAASRRHRRQRRHRPGHGAAHAEAGEPSRWPAQHEKIRGRGSRAAKLGSGRRARVDVASEASCAKMIDDTVKHSAASTSLRQQRASHPQGRRPAVPRE